MDIQNAGKFCPFGADHGKDYRLACEVTYAVGCEVFKPGDRFVISEKGVVLEQADAVCVYALMSLNPYIHGLMAGLDPAAFGPGFTVPEDPHGFYVHCLDPGYPCSTGGHVLIRAVREPNTAGSANENSEKEVSKVDPGIPEGDEAYRMEQDRNNAVALDFDYRLNCEVVQAGKACGIYRPGDRMTISGASVILGETDALCPFAFQGIMPFTWPLQRRQIHPLQIGLCREEDTEACCVECPNPGLNETDRTIFLIRRLPEIKDENGQTSATVSEQ